MNAEPEVIILCGGQSSESEVSLRSGRAVAAAVPGAVPPMAYMGVDAPDLRALVADYYNCMSRLDTLVGDVLAALERTGNEHRFAVADDAIAVVVESHHDALLHQLGQDAARSAAHADPGAAAAGHAARNSA